MVKNLCYLLGGYWYKYGGGYGYRYCPIMVGRLDTSIEAGNLGPRSSHELLVYVACGLLHILLGGC